MNVIVLLWIGLLQQDVLVIPSPDRLHVPDVYVSDIEVTDELEMQEIQVHIIEALMEAGYDVHSARVLAPDERGLWRPLPAHLEQRPAPPPKPQELKSAAGGSAVVRGLGAPGAMAGALSGKSIYISPGHGWYWSSGLGRWAAQRGNTHGLVEDFVNAEAITHYFLPLLQNAGATVFPIREPDRNPEMVLVDDSEAALTGEWSPGPPGWGLANNATLESGENPFALGGTQQTITAAETTATATFTGDLPKAGHYGVSVAWAAAPDRAVDVQVLIQHAGGETLVQVDQRRHGSTWMYLGRFPFHMGPAQVLIRNLSSGPGSSLSIDAVRFGGGMGRIERGTGSYPASGPTTGRARWESCARYHAQFQGAPESVYNSSSGNDSKDDVGARARYAAWQHEEGEDAVFVSWHTNAPNPARGTSTWVYGPNEPNGQYIFTGTEGSDALAAAVHEEIINAIRSEWDPEWKDRGIKSAWFGELNPNSNPEMPATLVEMAFHDTEADAIYLAEPRFRKTLAHAYYRGIVRYFAERDGIPAQYLPEPPMHVGAYGDVDGTVEVVWSPSDAGVASSAYRVWTSYDGHGFSVAAVTTTPSVRLEDLPQGVPLFVRVTATNEGGESFPSATLAVLPSCNSSEERALIVQGFTRLDRQSLPTVDLSPFSLGTVMRLEQEVVNTFDYAIEHAQALATLGIPFDAVEASVVESGQVALASYGAVDWILGEESTLDETFNETEQQHVADYLDGGGKLLVSGAEIAWDLDAQGSESDRNFCAQYLKVLLGQDDAGTQSLDTGVAFSSSYHVDFPDAFVPQDNATLLWEYSTGTVAAVSWTGAFSVVTVGFPLESVGDLDARSTLMSDAMQALGFDSATQHCTEPPPPPADEHSPAAEAGPDTGAAGQDTVARAPNIGGGVVTVRGGQHRQAEGGCTYGHGSSPYGLLFVTLLALVVLAGGRRWEPT